MCGTWHAVGELGSWWCILCSALKVPSWRDLISCTASPTVCPLCQGRRHNSTHAPRPIRLSTASPNLPPLLLNQVATLPLNTNIQREVNRHPFLRPRFMVAVLSCGKQNMFTTIPTERPFLTFPSDNRGNGMWSAE